MSVFIVGPGRMLAGDAGLLGSNSHSQESRYISVHRPSWMYVTIQKEPQGYNNSHREFYHFYRGSWELIGFPRHQAISVFSDVHESFTRYPRSVSVSR